MDELSTEIIEWDVLSWSRALQFWVAHSSHDLARASALEIGAGNGGLSLWLAMKGSRVLCTDLRRPLGAAMAKHRKYGVSHLVDYDHMNVLDMSATDKYDIVLFKSLLGAVGSGDHPDRQRRAIQNIYVALKPGGELWFAENLQASRVHQWLRKKYVRWGTAWRYVSLQEMVSYLAPYYCVVYEVSGFLAAFGRTNRQHELLARIDQLVMNRLVAPSDRYVIYGVAKKSRCS